MAFRKTLILCIVFGCVVPSLKANYYQSDLFPIGLTGINGTGGNPPYSNAGADPPWAWTPAESENNEQGLIFDLGINCLGCEDAKVTYLIDWKPTSHSPDNKDNYLYKVCKPWHETYPDSEMICIITASYYTTAKTMLCPGITYTGPDTVELGECGDTILGPNQVFFLDTTDVDEYEPESVHTINPWKNQAASALFRSPYRNSSVCAGIGPTNFGAPQLSAHIDSDPYNRHGRNISDGDNWASFDGDSTWKDVVDEAIINFDSFFTHHGDLSKYIWGYNLITEDPAVSRNNQYKQGQPPWRGCWAAVDYIFTGHKGTSYFLGDFPAAKSHSGIRGVEDTNTAFTTGDNKGHRMFIAKYFGPATLHRGGYNIFEALPDLDAFVAYAEVWAIAQFDYGQQEMFDWYLYGIFTPVQGSGLTAHVAEEKLGYHNTAIYFQQYGNTPGGPAGQKRRWIAAPSLKCTFSKSDPTKGVSRHPCPPELRCAVYLAMSRGAKGILFHGWSFDPRDTVGLIPCPNLEVPYTDSKPSDLRNVGLRDPEGWPFGVGPDGDKDTYSLQNHKLNNGEGTTYWYQNNHNYTYVYLKDELIPEIKAISGVLMQLEWDSAFSIRSTDPNWEDPCPHLYVDSVATTDSGYIELGFFKHYQWRDQGKYLMVVNRDGIAQMDTAEITLYLDFDGDILDSLHVVEYGDPDTSYFLTKNTSDNRFHLTRDYAPGEGKLFRFYPIKAGSGDKPKLMLWGECKKTYGTTGIMEGLNEVDTFCAELTWTWSNYKPSDLTAMELWMKEDDTWECIRDSHPTWKWMHTDTVFMCCDSCCAEFLEFGYHPSGDTITEPEELSGAVGTKSDSIEICCNMTSGCPDLYSLICYDTTLSPGYLFLENNTILPHSEHTLNVTDEDLLKLDMINTDPDYYYINIVENASTTTFLDQVKLWVVDHDEGTQVATSTDDSIYVYSEMVAPISCKDNQDNDRLDEVLWLDGLSFVGPPNSYVIAEFDDPEWTNKGILAVIDGAEAAKASIIDLQKVGGGGEGWDSIGVTYARLNSSQWLINVSDVDSLRFRLMCGGSDTTRINRIALVKLESNWTKQEATLDSAVHYAESGYGTYVQPLLVSYDELIDMLFSDEQISLRFAKVDSSSTYPLRDYVFQSIGYYSTAITPPSGIEEEPLQFGLRVEQLTPLSRIALINYSVPYSTHVKIAIYDVAGRLIKSVIDDKVKPGRYSEEWKGKDDAGRTLASGIYFVKMMTDDYKKTVKVVILE